MKKEKEEVKRCTVEKRVCKSPKYCNCNKVSPNFYRCTRRKGHTGPHIACGITVHNVAIWWSEG